MQEDQGSSHRAGHPHTGAAGLTGLQTERGLRDKDWPSVGHEPRAQSGARIKHGRLIPPAPQARGHWSRLLQGPPPRVSPWRLATHTPASVPERWRPLVVKKENALCFADVFVSVGEKTSRFEESMGSTFLLGLCTMQWHAERRRNTPAGRRCPCGRCVSVDSHCLITTPVVLTSLWLGGNKQRR